MGRHSPLFDDEPHQLFDCACHAPLVLHLLGRPAQDVHRKPPPIVPRRHPQVALERHPHPFLIAKAALPRDLADSGFQLGCEDEGFLGK
jgi:hypothetical protein